MIDPTVNAVANPWVLYRLIEVSSIFAGQSNKDRISFRGLAAFASAALQCWRPCLFVGEATSSGTSLQTVNLLLVGARGCGGSLWSTRGGVARSPRQFQETNRLLRWNFTRFSVTLGLCACSAAWSASVGALFFCWWIIPFSFIAKYNAVLLSNRLTINLGSKTFATFYTLALAAFGIKGISPARSNLVRDAVDDAVLREIHRHAAEDAATARALDLLTPLTLFAGSGSWH